MITETNPSSYTQENWKQQTETEEVGVRGEEEARMDKDKDPT